MEESIILYTIGCPQCDYLESLLKKAHVKYSTFTNQQEMRKQGIFSSPMLKVGNTLMNYADALRWIGGKANEN
jgi:hypothetical protein